jgi:2-keto-4-pentenoate hydratase/2-oxohepta-3-ene-1,7-dioic acid hydratase in catechol pathway
MKLGRVLRETLEGAVPRLVVVQPEQRHVIDLATAEYERLLRTGASADAARRLATALYPASMSAALAAALNMTPQIPEVYYELPIYYKGNPLTFIAHEQEVPWPDYTQRMDYELELGFVIGRAGKDLTPGQAKAHLFGVTIFNDFSARDMQAREMQGLLGPAKGKDFATALGPWITTVDELDVHNLTMVARVNGEEWSRGSSSTILWRVEEIIAYISKAEGVQAGELIGSGTVGWGCGMEHGKFLKPGDVVELEVEGIGVLRNKMGTPAPAGWMPPRRTSATV